MWSNGLTKFVTGATLAVRPGAPPRGTRLVPKVNYVGSAGQEHVIDAVLGESVMVTAVKNGVPGIVGECGGNASCGTCHVWVREEFVALTGEPGELEEDLLDMAVTERRDGSRLSCQVRVTEELDGLTVDVPSVQP
jgi:2Fe-2S ferredoxin